MNGGTSRWQAWAPLLACIAWLAATAWMRPLALPDEGRYAGVAWEMVRTGQWLTPTLDGLPYFHKPPLFYWITASALTVFGLHEWPARLAPFLGAVLAAASTFMFARRWFGDTVARWSLAVFATAPLSYFGAQYANLDMLVAGCITATLCCAAHAVLCEPGPARTWGAAGAWLFAALGVLAKGLIGAVLPFMVLVAWLALIRRPRGLLTLLSWRGALLFLAVAGPWFVLMQERFPGFSHYFFVVQHFQRFSGTGFNNAHGAWFYPAVLVLLALPWTPWALAFARSGYWRSEDRLPQRLLLVAWTLVITLFFSLPNSKLVGYIFPVAAPLAILLADGAVQLVGARRRWAAWLKATAAVAAGLCLVATIAFALTADVRQRELARALRAGLQAGDSIVFVDDYYFAVGFYARLQEPVKVVSDWSPAAVQSRDNWRKELGDAAQFLPGQRLLLGPAAMDALPCEGRRLWVMGAESAVQAHPWLANASSRTQSRGLNLWRIDPAAPGGLNPACAGTPSANSAGKS